LYFHEERNENMALITMKFGGTSVGSVGAITNLAQIVQDETTRSNQVIVVVSAMSKVTDMLIESVNQAAQHNKWEYISTGRKILDRHIDTLNQLLPANKNREDAIIEITTLFKHHEELCQAINVLGEATPRIMDGIVSFGERLSARMIAAVLRERGIKAKAFDAGEFLITNNQYESAAPLWDETQHRVDTKLKPEIAKGVTPVITGFIGQTIDGQFTTLGRGGSDYSGAIFAATTDSNELIIWTDVDGVMTTDPRIDKRARVLPYVSYQEVGELAFYGAKVLHPKTVQPIVGKGIPMRVRNTFNPSFEGTLIGPDSQQSDTIIKAVTSVNQVNLLTVSGKGMMGVPGIAGRAFRATAEAGASILMMSQASSEQSFCFLVPENNAQGVKQAIEDELRTEIAQGDVDSVAVLEKVTIITVVGAGMRGTPGVAGRVFTMMGDHRVNIIAIAQATSECSISFVVDEASHNTAVIALHELALEAIAT
jgi:bifunctional aspartokinase / homoserine dehydrogenase 1